jgi:hypothetical protein
LTVLTKFLAKEGQFLLPLLDSILTAETAVDEVLDVVWRSAIEAILLLMISRFGSYESQASRWLVLRIQWAAGRVATLVFQID